MLRRCALLAPVLLLASPAFALDFPEIQKRGTLKVLAVHEDLFFTTRQAPIPGFDREVLEGFASLSKLKLEVVQVPGWDQMIPWLLEGKGDVIVGGYAATESRQKQIAFSAEVFPSRKVVMTRKPTKPVKTLDDLKLLKVGTVKGTSMADLVATLGLARDKVDDEVPSGTLPAALKSGRVEAIVYPVEHAILERRADPTLELGMFVGPPLSLGFGLRKGDTALKQALDQYIENLRHTPTWSRLVVKYLGEDAPDVLKKARE